MFRNELPRIYELRDQIENPHSPNSCDLDRILQKPGAIEAWRTLENELQGLDCAAWESLKKEASLTKWDEKHGRGREPLLNIINQARAYNFLRKNGCIDIRFIPRSNTSGEKTPDLEGMWGSVKVICEVKTINPSDDEVLRRLDGNSLHNEPLGQGFFDKLTSDLTNAKKQIEAFDSGRETRHIVYIIPNFDALWNEYNRKEEDFKQIDQYLWQNAVSGIEIVFHNQKTTWHKPVTMKYATVVNDE